MESYWIPFILNTDDEEDELKKPIILVGNKVLMIKHGEQLHKIFLSPNIE